LYLHPKKIKAIGKEVEKSIEKDEGWGTRTKVRNGVKTVLEEKEGIRGQIDLKKEK